MSTQLSIIRQNARKLGKRGARAAWHGWTPEQKSREMSRRRRLGIARRKKVRRTRENTGDLSA